MELPPPVAWAGSQRLQLALVCSICGLLGLSLLDPQFPVEQLLEHIPTVVSLGVILLGVRRRWWSTLAVVCLMAFAVLHIVGARYVYSLVPYDEVLRTTVGVSLHETFGLRRNHYDRLVHFLFGMLMPLPVAEVIARRSRIPATDNVVLSISFLTAFSGLYEVSEWLAAIVMSPDMAENYNGQQGDVWDPQKDMALAFLGNLLVAYPVWRCLRSRNLAATGRRDESTVAASSSRAEDEELRHT